MPDLMGSGLAKAAIFGLAFVAVTACGSPKTETVSIAGESFNLKPEIALVEGGPITLNDLRHYAQANSLIGADESLDVDNPEFSGILEDLIDQRLLAMDALVLSLDQTVESQRRLSAARERILSSIRIEAYLQEKVSTKAVRTAYDTQMVMGRDIGTFEAAEPDIRRLLTAQAIEALLQDLRREAKVTRLEHNIQTPTQKTEP